MKQIHIHLHSKTNDAPLRVVKNLENQKTLAAKGELFKIVNGAYVKVSPGELPLDKPVYGKAGSIKDARSKGQIENDLDDVQEEIDKYEDRGLTVPVALREKRKKLQAEYNAESEFRKSEFRNSGMKKSKDRASMNQMDADPKVAILAQGIVSDLGRIGVKLVQLKTAAGKDETVLSAIRQAESNVDKALSTLNKL